VINIAKKIIRLFLQKAGFDIRRVPSPNPRKSYSNLEEQSILRRYLDELAIDKGFCVDIGASDGVTMSNTLALYMNGWNGLAVEYDPAAFSALAATYANFPKVLLARCAVTPANVLGLLAGFNVPGNFGVLSLDIDGYDFFVLEQILTGYRPALVCTEINENIPPPLKFTVKWNPDYAWHRDHFFGQSLSQLHTLCVRHNYALVELHYNNAFLIPRELTRRPALSAEEAYRTGYLDKPDRRKKFPWNEDMEELLHLRPEEGLAFINKAFGKYKGMFDASI
jgi:hypothetical protein